MINDPVIHVSGLRKEFSVYDKKPGFMGSLSSLWRREYRKIVAVDDVSFSIRQGEIVGLIGANGAGKSTTLKLLSGLLHPTAGLISVAGFGPQSRSRQFLRSVALVMGQRMQLDWDISPADFYLTLKVIFEIPEGEFKSRLDRLASMLDAGHLINRQTRRLSLGERMKCELIASLIHNPTVIFLDEPTIGLDVNVQQALRRFIAEYNREAGATIILSSHYMADLTSLTDRVLIIDRGKLLFDGEIQAFMGKSVGYKLLRITSALPIQTDILNRFGKARSIDPYEAEIEVKREEVVSTAAELIKCLSVVDIGIEEVPIESVIGDLFDKGGRGARFE